MWVFHIRRGHAIAEALRHLSKNGQAIPEHYDDLRVDGATRENGDDLPNLERCERHDPCRVWRPDNSLHRRQQGLSTNDINGSHAHNVPIEPEGSILLVMDCGSPNTVL